MFALVAASILAAGVFVFADLSAKATLNQERATRAVHVADAGVSHALSLLRGSLRMHSFTRILRGSDNFIPTADDSLLINFGLAANDQIPLAGKAFQGHTYFVSVRDDPSDGDANAATDLNGRVLVRCRSLTSDGATTEVSAIVGAVPMPAVAADGNVNFSGSPQILGACGSAHANGNISGGGSPVVSIQATATGTATGNFDLPNGSNAPMLGGQLPIDVPTLAPLTFCAGADYRLTSTGTVVNVVTGVAVATATGWTMSSGPPEVRWTLSSGLSVPGTYCVEGNAVISGNTGSSGTPAALSVIATGSIEVSGNPFLRADHEDGILFLAGGDMSISGNPSAGVNNFQGMIYAGAQCKMSGNPTIFGQLLCNNGPQPPNSTNHVSLHDISGNFTLTFDCSANVFNKRRVLFWYPRIGV
jgi:hypothetical protein